MRRKKRGHKRHVTRFYTCDGCGGRVDFDAPDTRLMVRGADNERGFTRLVLHERDECRERAKTRFPEMSEETKARVEWREFVRENPTLATAILAVSAITEEER